MARRQTIARKHEEDIAARFGGKRQPGSGNQWHSKGDVVTSDSLIEAKFTDSGEYPLTRKLIEKTQQDCNAAQRDFWIIELWFRSYKTRVYVLSSLDSAFYSPNLLLDLCARKSLVLSPYRSVPITECSGWGKQFYIVSEEQMDHIVTGTNPLLPLVQVFNSFMWDVVKRPSTRKVGVISPSTIDYCQRRNWYRLTGVDPEPSTTPNKEMVFRIGRLVHTMIQDDFALLFGDGFEAEVPLSLPQYFLDGSCDGIITHADKIDTLPNWVGENTRKLLEEITTVLSEKGNVICLEIKSCSQTPSSPKAEHLSQAMLYAGVLGATHCLVFYVNKGSGEVMPFLREFDAKSWDSSIAKIKNLLRYYNDRQTPPREITRECSDCPYSRPCAPSTGSVSGASDTP